jgi:exopolysaccharide biosynthesis polyprenyl glycosylphosphotransferase
MLLDAGTTFQTEQRAEGFQKLVSALSSSIRETDIAGWYKNDSVVGAILTEIGVANKSAIQAAVLARVSAALHSNLDLEQITKIHISFHLFPEEGDKQSPENPADSKLYPNLPGQGDAKNFPRLIKRTMDIAGSILALIVFSPLFVAIALAIKLSSKGPILFRQDRVGQYGKSFTFLKFRSMHCASDHSLHKEYVRRLIAGKTDPKQSKGGPKGVYKLVADPRVTRVGEFLRKTSLDEFPQFLNVLKGEMSLVGPRPPIPYEFESYDIWHRRRVLEVKPGITGLWQVTARSRTKFDDMVRLDLRYAKAWSLWLDIKILLQTPGAVFSGEGAY